MSMMSMMGMPPTPQQHLWQPPATQEEWHLVPWQVPGLLIEYLPLLPGPQIHVEEYLAKKTSRA